jgi:hypothetical protein
MARAAAAAENAALNGLAGVGNTNVIPYVSLHTADPGTSGATENPSTSGYIRQACSWNAAAAGSTAVTHFGTYSASTAGTYALGGALASGVTAASITIAAGAISVTIT